ncbi:MAG: WG repeat-containing protein [Clostridiales bacterium]|nr:WG repeat-containing protein [Clostridiales bacterium]
MKKRILDVILVVVLLVLVSACGTGGAEPGELKAELVDPGIDCLSLRFEDAGEGLYLLEAVLAGGLSKFGFMDGTGSVVIPLIYDKASIFTEGLACVELDGSKYFIDHSGSEMIDMSEYGYIAPFELGFAMVTRIATEEIDSGVRLTYYRGMIDTSGTEVIPCDYEEAGTLENGMLWGKLDGKFAIFDNSGSRITPREYDYVSYANEDLIIAQDGEKYGYLDLKGNVAIPFEYDMVGKFFDGCALVANDWLASFINTQGEKITPIEFEAAEDFSEGLAAVSKDGMFGFIDTQGNTAVPFMYDEVWSFKGGVSIVLKRLGSTLTSVETIDKYGETAIMPNHRGYYKWKNTHVAYNEPESGFNGVNFNILALLSDDGIRLTKFDYTEIFDFCDGIAVMETADDFSMFYGLINQFGAEIIPAVNERVVIVNNKTAALQFEETDPETGTVRSWVAIVALPGDAATRRPPALEE